MSYRIKQTRFYRLWIYGWHWSDLNSLDTLNWSKYSFAWLNNREFTQMKTQWRGKSNESQMIKLGKHFWLFCAIYWIQRYYFVPWRDLPSPMYPSLQVQLWEPSVLVQSAFRSQTLLLPLHSFISNWKVIERKHFMQRFLEQIRKGHTINWFCLYWTDSPSIFMS